MFHFILLVLCISSTTALRLEDANEGDCGGTPFKPFSTTDIDLVDKFRYISAGNRYDQYTISYGHPRFAQMTEDELRNNVCLTHNGTDSEGRGNTFGFGGLVLGTFHFTPKAAQANVFDFEYYPRNSGGVPLVRGSETLTLTDYENFMFFANCFTVDSTEHKAWEVISLTPNLSSATIKTIEEHAVSLGFNRDDFFFLNYKNCKVSVDENTKG